MSFPNGSEPKIEETSLPVRAAGTGAGAAIIGAFSTGLTSFFS